MSNITVIRSTTTPSPKGYKIVELAYKTEDGKTKGMKIFPFGQQKEVYEVAAAVKPGAILKASLRQNEKGFWEFSSLEDTGEQRAVSTEDSSALPKRAGGGWETSEERAKRQEIISRQAVLNTAVAFFEATKQKPSEQDVINVASKFYDYVHNKPLTVTGDVQ